MHIQIGHQFHFDDVSVDNLIQRLNHLFGENTFIIEQNGRSIDLTDHRPLPANGTYKIWPKILGGKGGFGSLLRSFGKQILISKNKEACRDLNGRRMRDVNNEQKLKEWMQKQLEKSVTPSDHPLETRKTSSDNDYRNVPPPHKFSDAAYDEQKKQIAEDMDEAVKIAAELMQAEKVKNKKKSKTAISTNDEEEEEEKKTTTTKKRRHSEDDALEDGEVKSAKAKNSKATSTAFFLGIDLGDVSSEEDDDEEPQKKKAKA